MSRAVSVTDAAGNTYEHLTDLTMNAQSLARIPLSGAAVEVFWCESSVGAVANLTAHWDGPARNRMVMMQRFRNHDGGPFEMRTWGNYSPSVYLADRVPVAAPSPLPDWTMARANGRVFLGCYAALRPGGAASTQSFESLELGGPFGTSRVDGAMQTASSTRGTGLLGAGVTAGLDPTWINYMTGFPGTPWPEVYRVAYGYGMNPTPGNSIPDLGATTWAVDGAAGQGSALTTTGMLLLPAVAAGDGILVFASSAEWLAAPETQYQRIYGWRLNISDDALATVDPMLTSPQDGAI